MSVYGSVDVIHNYLLQHKLWGLEVELFLHQLLDLIQRSHNTEIIIWFSSWLLSKFTSKFFRKDSNSSLAWHGDQ